MTIRVRAWPPLWQTGGPHPGRPADLPVRGSWRLMKSAFRIDSTLTLVVLAVLIAGCFLVLQPFLTAIVWAAILCVTMWPLFHAGERLAGRPPRPGRGSRWWR